MSIPTRAHRGRGLWPAAAGVALAVVVSVGALFISAPAGVAASRAVTAVPTVASTTAARSGPRWHRQTVPSVPTRSATLLYAISCPTKTFCLAVGGRLASSTGARRVAIEVWDGTTWQAGTAAALGGDRIANAVSCATADVCTVVGEEGSSQPRPFIARYQSGAWSVETSAFAARGDTIDAVSCATATSCEAVGAVSSTGHQHGVGFAEGWNGQRWAGQTLPKSEAGYALAAVSCAPGGTCDAVGYNLPTGANRQFAARAYRLSEGRWKKAYTAKRRGQSVLSAVSCPTAKVCVAVGSFSTLGLLGGNKIDNLSETLTPTGATWAPMLTRVHGQSVGVDGVSCISATVCRAVGGTTGSGGGLSSNVVEAFGGHHWTQRSSAQASGHSDLVGVSCVGPDLCRAAGFREHPGNNPDETLPLILVNS
jgi:hypothetical protein